jgi:hypothetical protein
VQGIACLIDGHRIIAMDKDITTLGGDIDAKSIFDQG